jgi:hypothetical protein
MTALLPDRTDKMHVVAGYVHSLNEIRAAQSNDGAAYVREVELGLLRRHVQKGRVRLVLRGNASGAES